MRLLSSVVHFSHCVLYERHNNLLSPLKLSFRWCSSVQDGPIRAKASQRNPSKSAEVDFLLSELHAIRQKPRDIDHSRRLVSLFERSRFIFRNNNDIRDLSEVVKLLEHVLFTLIQIQASPASCNVVYEALRPHLPRHYAMKVRRSKENNASSDNKNMHSQKSILDPKGVHYSFAQYLLQWSFKCKEESVLSLPIVILLIHAPQDGNPASLRPSSLVLMLKTLNRWNAYKKCDSTVQGNVFHGSLGVLNSSTTSQITQIHHSPLTVRLERWWRGRESHTDTSNNTRFTELMALLALLKLASCRPVPWTTVITGIQEYWNIIFLKHTKNHSLFLSFGVPSRPIEKTKSSSFGSLSTQYYEKKKALQESLWSYVDRSSVVTTAIQYVDFIKHLHDNFVTFSRDNQPNVLSDRDCRKGAAKLRSGIFLPLHLYVNHHTDLKNNSDPRAGIETTLSAWIIHVWMESLEVAKEMQSAEDWLSYSEKIIAALQQLLLMLTDVIVDVNDKHRIDQEVWFLILEAVRRGVFPTVVRDISLKGNMQKESLRRLPHKDLLSHEGLNDVMVRVVLPFYSSRYWSDPTLNLFVNVLHDQGNSSIIKEVFLTVQEEERLAQSAIQAAIKIDMEDDANSLSSRAQSTSSHTHKEFHPALSLSSCSIVMKHCCDLGDPFTAKDVLRYMLTKMLIMEESHGEQDERGGGLGYPGPFTQDLLDPNESLKVTTRWRRWIEEEGIPIIEKAAHKCNIDAPYDWVLS